MTANGHKTEDLSAPLTPADCDLRGLPYMPLDVIRLLDSDMFAEATGDEFKAAVALWCKSWTQVPAASLPNKDKVLAHLSGNAEKWKRIKAGAMRGWILCSDDRWYHPVVAEKALAALPGREEFNSKKSAEAERKAREREDRKALFEALKGHGVTPDWNVSTKALRGLAAQYLSQEPPGQVTEPERDMSHPVTVSKGEKKGEGELTSKPQDHYHHAGSIGDCFDPLPEPPEEPPSVPPHLDDFDPPLYGAPLPPREDPKLDDQNPAIRLAVALRKWGVNATFTHPDVQAWSQNEKVTLDILAAAVAEARETKGDERLSPRYLLPIVARLLNPPPMVEGKSQQQRDDNSWAASDSGITDKARELKLKVLPIHSYADVKRMCFDEIRKRKGT
jgi:hypothetical protein